MLTGEDSLLCVGSEGRDCNDGEGGELHGAWNDCSSVGSNGKRERMYALTSR